MPVLNITIPCPGCCTPKFCHDLLGDTLSVAVSGILNCADCYTFTALPGQSFKFAFTAGVNGVHTVTWDGFSAWTAVIGTETLSIYSDGVCGTLDSATDLDITLSVTCADDNQFTATISWQGAISGTLFRTLAAAGIGDPISNIQDAASCGNEVSFPNIPSGYGGTITVSP